MAVSQEQAHRAWRAAERIKRLSDRLVGVGPFGIGLDGALAFAGPIDAIYSVGAGLLLLGYGFAAGASAQTLIRMGLYVAGDSALSGIPFLGWAADVFIQGHLMAANALQKDIERRHGPSDLPGWGGKKKTKARKR
jgi:hypothetical protein